MLKLIKNLQVYAPERLGNRDILIAAGKIARIAEQIDEHHAAALGAEIIDGGGKTAVPGFIDNHVHILGGGGEGGYKTRTPELALSTAVKAGVTTVVGCIGTDGVTRKMESLVAKAKGLKEEGLSCFLYTGSYDVPVRTLTGDIRSDLILVEEIIGVGEIAVSDHRSSAPTKDELARIAANARVGGMLSGKAGVVNIHVGDAPQMLEMLVDIVSTSAIPITQFLPTHITRNLDLFRQGIEFAKRGGHVDFTTGSAAHLSCSHALRQILDAGVPIEAVTFSSDGQGSLPKFDASGRLCGMKVGMMDSLFADVRNAVLCERIPFETALKVITSNVAEKLRLSAKGRLAEGMDADIVLLGAELEIDTVISGGRIMLLNGELLIKGTFE